MKYENLINEFMENFPELEMQGKKELERWRDDEPPVHVFFGNVLNPFLIHEALVKMDNQKLLKRIFEFMEKMALSDDKKVREVLTVTILEQLGDDDIILEKARKLMGKETLELSHAIEKFWGREQS